MMRHPRKFESFIWDESNENLKNAKKKNQKAVCGCRHDKSSVSVVSDRSVSVFKNDRAVLNLPAAK
jgi:hypothetical protein